MSHCDIPRRDSTKTPDNKHKIWVYRLMSLDGIQLRTFEMCNGIADVRENTYKLRMV